MFAKGERVIFCCPNPKLDGTRGTVTKLLPDAVQVRFDNGEEISCWSSKLAREADNPDYPLPMSEVAEPPQ